ncbi:MAG TPA: hypothetical protein VM889_10355 [Candidatus Thermoplasmatota archaeon]|nr:hypothetical protein [Candidatus Thermoplasmatota archaeon]
MREGHFQDARRRFRRRALARRIGLLAAAAALVVAVGFLALLARPTVQGLHVAGASSLDDNRNGVPDIYENAVFGLGPEAQRPSGALPLAWIQKHGLDVADPALANRTAAVPAPSLVPAVYGRAGYPAEFSLTLAQVYAHGRPATWSEAQQGAWDSGLDPRAWDVAGSGVPYGWLLYYGLDPLDPSLLDRASSEVSWTPREAWRRGLSPLSPDQDADGLPDLDEIERHGTNPRAASTASTGIHDGWLVAHGLDPLDPAVAYQDPDLDGLDNLEEFEASRRLFGAASIGSGLDPLRFSTGGSGLPDGWLVAHGLPLLDPTVGQLVTERVFFPNGTLRGILTAGDEYRVNRPPSWNESIHGAWFGGTDPNAPDTDGDGLSDADEILGWAIESGGRAKMVFSDPTKRDTDGDGLTDFEEREGRWGTRVFPVTDPTAPDTDFDGLLDGEEVGAHLYRGIALEGLDPTNPDTDGDGLFDGREAAYWMARRAACLAGLPYEWGRAPRPTLQDVLGGGPSACDRLLPTADLEGDGRASILDPDSDGDGLFDGWEVDPDLYQTSSYASARRRSETDPANLDTDGDRLPDGWETRYAVFDETAGRWNLDAAKWSSAENGIGDGDQDLDDDGAVWYAFVRDGARLVPERRTFVASNFVEFEAGSDPNRRSSSPDGIPDGWKIFWGTTYLGLLDEERGVLYPGAPGPLVLPPDRPVPRLGNDDNTPRQTQSYVRFAEAASGRLMPWEKLTSVPGTPSTLRAIAGQYNETYGSKVGHGTNPYLEDTDGDGVSDLWESIWAPLGPAGSRVSPVQPDAHFDVDGDGLTWLEESRLRSDPYRADSDGGGADDRLESKIGLNLLDPRDDARALDESADTDGDGVSDRSEVVGWISPTSSQQYVTDPLDPDTDRDGLLDGKSLSRILGRVLRLSDPDDLAIIERYEARGLLAVPFGGDTVDILGESGLGSDPTSLASAGDGIPDGWLVLHGLPVGEGSGRFEDYVYGRPAWWNETKHGVWRWGRAPGVATTSDHDGDGLDDRNGEDPLPFAGPGLRPRRGDPREDGLDPLEVLKRAQAWGRPPREARAPIPARERVVVVLDPLPSPLALDAATRFSGRVTTASGEPVVDAVALFSLQRRDLVLGVATTNETGHFSGYLQPGGTTAASAEMRDRVVFSSLNGDGTHVNDPRLVSRLDLARPIEAFVWVYNTSSASPESQRGPSGHGFLGADSASRSVRLNLPTTLLVDRPARVGAGEYGVLNATLRDAFGRPVVAAEVAHAPSGATATTDVDGRVSFRVLATRDPGLTAHTVSFGGREPALLPSESRFDWQVFLRPRIDLQILSDAVRPGGVVFLAGRIEAGGRPVADALKISAFGTDVKIETDAHGEFHVSLPVPVSAPLGAQTLEARYAGNEELGPAYAAVAFELLGVPGFEIPAWRGEVGAVGHFRARLVDAVGAGLPRSRVEVDGPDIEKAQNVTDAEGYVTFAIDLRRAEPGDRIVFLRYDGGAKGVARQPHTLVATSATAIRLDPVDAIRGRSVEIAGTLVDARGVGVARQLVVVAFGTETGETITDLAGRFAISFVPGEATGLGPIRVAASYAGSKGGALAASEGVRIAQVRDAARLTGFPASTHFASPTLEAQVTTLLGRAVVSRNVEVEGPWGQVRGTTDASGRFRVSLPLPADAALGPMSLVLRVRDEPQLVGFELERVLELRDRGRLEVELPDAAFERTTLTVPFSLKDSVGREVTVESLNVSVDGRARTLLVRDRSFSLPLGPEIAPGFVTIEVAAPNRLVDAAPFKGILGVHRLTEITVETLPGHAPGEPAFLVVKLAAGDDPVANATLHVLGVGDTALAIRTGADGRAVVPIPQTALVRSEYAVVYRGGEGTAPTLAGFVLEPALVASEAPPQTDVLAVAAGIAAVFAIIWALVRRGRAASDVLASTSRRLLKDPKLESLYRSYLELLAIAGLDEERAETATFGDVAARFVRNDPSARPDLDLLTEVFNLGVYAPELLEPERIREAGFALGRLAALSRTPEAA